MTSDSGLINQDSDYARQIQEALDELSQMQQSPQLVTNPEALEALEGTIRQRTDHLGSLLVGHHLQESLDSADLQMEQDLLVSQWPKPLKSDGKVQVHIRTAQGDTVAVWVTYYRRKGQRRKGRRYAGVYAGLVLLGIYDPTFRTSNSKNAYFLTDNISMSCRTPRFGAIFSGNCSRSLISSKSQKFRHFCHYLHKTVVLWLSLLSIR